MPSPRSTYHLNCTYIIIILQMGKKSIKYIAIKCARGGGKQWMCFFRNTEKKKK